MSRLIGRENEIGLIKSYINEMKSFHIHGPEGAGKTAVLEFIYQNWLDMNTPLIPIFCRTSRTLREILQHISGFLLHRSFSLEDIDKFKRIKEIYSLSDLKAANSRDLKNMIFNNIGQKKFCIILDHLDYVTPKINTFLTTLKDHAVMITASRQSCEIKNYSFRGKLDCCLCQYPKLGIENLKRKNAFVLMECLCGNMNINLPHKPQNFEEIYNISKGNPKKIGEILDKAKNLQNIIGNSLKFYLH